ncbi:MAG: hypothetical protein NT150_01255 [Bacteroidetes bacterium]|nr:hypothetical protein [Bacteroidota bacterium]
MKNKLLISAFLVLIGIAIYLWLKPDDKSAFRAEMRDFAVENINAVDKIFITEKNGKSVTLTKEGKIWKVDGKFTARPDAIETLLLTLNKVKVKNRVPKEGMPQIIKNIAIQHKKIDIYSNDEIIKSYFIGGKTMESDGTYMLMQDASTGLNSTVPFVTGIDGFEGYLTERYIAKPDLWRDARIIYFPEMTIKSIQMEYPAQPSASFKIALSDGNISVYPLKSNTAINTNPVALKTYLLNFKEVAAESFITEGNKKKLDSLLTLQPVFILTVQDNLGNKTTVKGYPRKTQAGETDYAGQVIEYDVDRFYGVTMNDKELCILQFYVFDRLTKKLSDFQ